MKFFIKDFFSKCDHLPKKSSMKNLNTKAMTAIPNHKCLNFIHSNVWSSADKIMFVTGSKKIKRQ